MQKFANQLFTNCLSLILTATVFLAACGGGESTVSPTPGAALITVVKSGIDPETNAAAREVALATNAGATIVAANVRCISYFAGRNAPPGTLSPAVQSKALILDISPADAEKVKPLGFKVFNASDFDPFFAERC